MGQADTTSPVKLICGAIFRDAGAMELAAGRMAEEFGPFDLRSGEFPFDYTDYYRDEMGDGLKKTFFAFARLLDPALLPDVKRRSNAVEAELAEVREGRSCRRVNLDPGYVTAAKLVLATTKDFSHRIYLRDGIFAEVTVGFRKGGCVAFPWTYPDFRSGRYDAFLLRVRQALADTGDRECHGYT